MAVALQEVERRTKLISFESMPDALFSIGQEPIKVIEFVCQTNSILSKTSALLAENHLRRMGIYGDYIVDSSGTNVSDLLEHGSDEFRQYVIKQAESRGLNSLDYLLRMRDANVGPSPKILDRYYKQALAIFLSEERAWRKEVLAEIGIEGKLKSHRDQTYAVPDRVAVLTMTQSQRNHVSSLYAKTDFLPDVIDTLPAFATGEHDAEMFECLGRKRDDYIDAVAQLTFYIPYVVEKIVKKTAV